MEKGAKERAQRGEQRRGYGEGSREEGGGSKGEGMEGGAGKREGGRGSTRVHKTVMLFSLPTHCPKTSLGSYLA